MNRNDDQRCLKLDVKPVQLVENNRYKMTVLRVVKDTKILFKGILNAEKSVK